jgi:hypothetical protein
MSWHDFIFSPQRKIRLLRHGLFWLAWWLYFFGSRYFYPAVLLTGKNGGPRNVDLNTSIWNATELVRSILMVSVHMAACYLIIYFLLPRFLLAGKYLAMLAGLVVLTAVMVLASRFMDTIVLPIFTRPDPLADTAFYSSVFNGIVSAIKVIAAATAITLGKYWWKKQKEKEVLEREKINAELQLLKAQIHPGFLFTALNNIYVFSLAASPRAPELLLKLSDLLSYMLYECDQAVVPLEKEIARMKDYILLEKIRMESIELEQSVIGDLSGKRIAPLLLLPFIENSFKHSSGLTEQAWVNIDITVEGDILTMKLANGMMPEADGAGLQENGLANVQKRLTLLYPQKHELKISRELEMLVVLLKIQIGEKPLFEPEQAEHPGINEPLIAQPTLYAAQ